MIFIRFNYIHFIGKGKIVFYMCVSLSSLISAPAMFIHPFFYYISSSSNPKIKNTEHHPLHFLSTFNLETSSNTLSGPYSLQDVVVHNHKTTVEHCHTMPAHFFYQRRAITRTPTNLWKSVSIKHKFPLSISSMLLWR